MGTRLESFATIVIVVVAVVVGVAAVRLAFFPSTRLGDSTRPASPELLGESDWEEVLTAAILVDDTVGSPPVTVVEFMDLECPYCRQSYLAFADLRADDRGLADSVAHMIVHYPLGIHRFAVPAARAAECASDEGRLSDYVRLVFEKQDSLGLKPWVSYAVEAGIQDTVRFNACNTSQGPLPRVERGQAVARRIGVQSTPTILIDGWRLPTPLLEAADYSRAIRAALEGRRPDD